MANNFEDFILENVINRIDDVWLLYRPSYYKIFKDEQGYDVTNIADLHLYKGAKKFQKRNLSLISYILSIRNGICWGCGLQQ